MTNTGPLAEAIARCSAAQKAWQLLSWAKKRTILVRVSHLMVDRADDLAAVISKDCGKTLTDALSTEVVPATMALNWYLNTGRKFLKSHAAPAGNLFLFNKRSRIHYHPYGVVGIISPWNYPFSIPFSEVVMALVAGNGVVLKVATATTTVGRAIAALFADAGLPTDLLVLSDLAGAEAGPALVNGGVDKLFFTGSVEVGQVLMREAAPRLLPLVLELGGNDAAIIRADADLELAAKGLVWAGLSNAGQSCGGAQRLLVHRSVYPAFCDALARHARALRIGDPTDFGRDVGALINAKQKQGIDAQVAASLAQGARLLVEPGPEQNPPDGAGRSWMGPRIIVDVKPDHPVWREEVFGPVLAVTAYDTDDDAVALANDSTMGLTSSVWSRHHGEAKALARRIHAGAVLINDHLMSHGLAETPWGGFGYSGTGRTHGVEGMREMVRTQVVVDDVLPGRRRNPWWHPHSRSLYVGLRAMQRFLYAPGWGTKLASVPSLLTFFFRYWKK